MEHIVWYHHMAKKKEKKTKKKRKIERKIERKAEYGRVVSMAAAALNYDHHQRRGGKQYYDRDGRKERKITPQNR